MPRRLRDLSWCLRCMRLLYNLFAVLFFTHVEGWTAMEERCRAAILSNGCKRLGLLASVRPSTLGWSVCLPWAMGTCLQRQHSPKIATWDKFWGFWYFSNFSVFAFTCRASMPLVYLISTLLLYLLFFAGGGLWFHFARCGAVQTACFRHCLPEAAVVLSSLPVLCPRRILCLFFQDRGPHQGCPVPPSIWAKSKSHVTEVVIE